MDLSKRQGGLKMATRRLFKHDMANIPSVDIVSSGGGGQTVLFETTLPNTAGAYAGYDFDFTGLAPNGIAVELDWIASGPITSNNRICDPTNIYMYANEQCDNNTMQDETMIWTHADAEIWLKNHAGVKSNAAYSDGEMGKGIDCVTGVFEPTAAFIRGKITPDLGLNTLVWVGDSYASDIARGITAWETSRTTWHGATLPTKDAINKLGLACWIQSDPLVTEIALRIIAL